MPTLELDGHTAWDNIYSHRGIAMWPRPKPPSRLEPIAQPIFNPTFRIPSASKIFTMGSCFARNIEQHLAGHGFDVPSRRYFGGGLAGHVINLYNPHSMLQEIRWALNLEKRLTPDERLIQVTDDGWVDLHLHHGSPQQKGHVLEWIDKSEQLFAEFKDCPYFVVTLGLIEVWFDNEQGVYLNEPLNFGRFYRENETLQNYFAKRFVFKILTFAETYRATESVFSLIQQYGAPGCRAILTVSPVPLAGSFSGKDVLIANMYSKSVLRAAAEQICTRFDFVDYFPSYESIMLSPRSEVFEEDGIHVKDIAVAHNVRRMVDAYLEPNPAIA